MTDTIETLEEKVRWHTSRALTLRNANPWGDSEARAIEHETKASQYRRIADNLRSKPVVLGDEIGRAGR